MSALCGPVTTSDISRAAWYVLRRAALRDKVSNELQYFDVTVDHCYSDSGFIVRITVYRTMILEYKIADYEIADEGLLHHVSRAMESNLHLVAQLHHARLALRFPNRIKDVTVEINVERDSKTITVHFKNGHTATADELEVRGDLFLARCMMLYDLPTL